MMYASCVDKAHVVVNPVGWTAGVMQSRHVGAYPDSNIRHHIGISSVWIGLVWIDRLSRLNTTATPNAAQYVCGTQRGTRAHPEVVIPDGGHDWLVRQRV